MKGIGFTRSLRIGVMALALVLPAVASTMAADFVSVSSDSVNLRSGPGTNHDVLYKLPINYPLKIVERQGEWLKVEDFEKDRGWINASVTSKDKTYIVTEDKVNIRSGPSTNSDKIGEVTRQVVLKEIGRKGEWIQFKHPQLEGWIMNKFVWP